MSNPSLGGATGQILQGPTLFALKVQALRGLQGLWCKGKQVALDPRIRLYHGRMEARRQMHLRGTLGPHIKLQGNGACVGIPALPQGTTLQIRQDLVVGAKDLDKSAGTFLQTIREIVPAAGRNRITCM